MKTRLSINRETCKGCGLCVASCPKKVLEIDGGAMNSRGYHPAAVIKAEECIGCGICGIMCPDSAITVEKE